MKNLSGASALPVIRIEDAGCQRQQRPVRITRTDQ
jgi:hypothetical protein